MSKNSVHQSVLAVYHLQKPLGTSYTETKSLFEKIRAYINLKLKKTYPNRKWQELTKIEQDTFIYVTIRKDMLDRYIDLSKHDKITKELDAYVESTLLKEQALIRSHNINVENAFKRYNLNSMTENEKKKEYQEFYNNFRQINKAIPIPSYDEWLSDNQKYPMRIYDYIMDESNEFMKENADVYYASDSEIDHIILLTLLDEFKKRFNIQIDIKEIENCLNTVKNYEYPEWDGITTEVDSSLPISTAEQEEIIRRNHEFARCELKLKNHDFIIK